MSICCTRSTSKAIAIASAHLQRSDGQPIDAYFSVEKADNGFHVEVDFVNGYDNFGRPIFVPGGHCTVLVSKQWKVLDVLGGK